MAEQTSFKMPDFSAMHYTVWEMAQDTYAMNFGGVAMYLIVGKDRALLIDTCYGFGDIPGMIRKITPLPVVVVNTHSHGDHTGGNAFFPAVHLYRPPFSMHSIPGSRPLTDMPYRNYRKLAIEDGHVFDLGGRQVSVIAIPAHNESSIALLDSLTGFLFTGDELEAGQVLMFEPGLDGIARHLANMQKLQACRAEISALVPAHNGAPVNPALIDDFIQLDQAILGGTAHHVDDPIYTKMVAGISGGGGTALRAEFGKASLVYLLPKKYESSFIGHAYQTQIQDCLDQGLIHLDEKGFYPDKPVTRSELVKTINRLVPVLGGSQQKLPAGQAASSPIRRKDAYVLIALSLQLLNALGRSQASGPPGSRYQAADLHQSCQAALIQYEIPLYFLDHEQQLTRADIACIASYLVRKHRLLSLFSEGHLGDGSDELPYRLFTPPVLDPGRRYPLILFLHGGGEHGDDNQIQLLANEGGTVWAEKQLTAGEPACFVLAPQAFPRPGRMGWDEDHCRQILQLIDQLSVQLPIDQTRMCCTGMSMGGLGTWTMNLLDPSRFACMVSVCGTVGTHPDIADEKAGELAARLKDKAIWMFHAEDDRTADVNVSRRTYQVMTSQGATNTHYTEYPADAGWDHSSWVPTYADPKLRQWVFQQLG